MSSLNTHLKYWFTTQKSLDSGGGGTADQIKSEFWPGPELDNNGIAEMEANHPHTNEHYNSSWLHNIQN